jgi:hypothetical protein
MLKKVLFLGVLICLVPVLAGAASERGLTFVGKIEEIAIKSTISPVGMGPGEKSLVIKLDSKPKIDFRITNKDAARYGLIDTSRTSAVLLPGQVKGVGWKVRLTCNKEERLGGEPTYLVTKLERLD